jgi:hypothetical protein
LHDDSRHCSRHDSNFVSHVGKGFASLQHIPKDRVIYAKSTLKLAITASKNLSKSLYFLTFNTHFPLASTASTPMLTQEKTLQRSPKRLNKRILVLGSAVSRPGIAAHLWNDLPPDINVADYDVIILNLVSFLTQQKEFGIRPERLPTWQQLARLLFNATSEIICIGIPGEDTNSLYQAVTWWLPVTPHFVLNSGETIRDVKSEFAFYFEHVRRWYFYATPQFKAHFLGLAHYLRLVHPKANNLQAGMGVLARNGLDQPIAFKLMFRAGSVEQTRSLPTKTRGKSSSGTAPLINSGSAIWLPPPTEISVDEAINLILRERYSLVTEQKPPAWASAYSLPEQEVIQRQITTYQQEIERLNQALALAEQQLLAASGVSRLLYEQSHDALARVVCAVLRELGAQSHDPQPPHQDVIRFRDPGNREAVVLVRSRFGPLPLGDLRQLDQWVRDLLVHQEWRGKGILIANTEASKAPNQRGEAFPPSAIRAAQHLGYCLVTTTQLFQAIATHQHHQLDRTQFWNMLFDANGICPLPEL